MTDSTGVISKQTHFIMTAAVTLATLMQTLDSTIANVALPHIQGALSGTQAQIAWVLTSYIIATAITIPFTGWLATCIGRRRVFLVSIAGFVVTSMMCGLAEDLPEIVIYRFLQGICGASLMPLSQAVLLSINSKENSGKAMALWGFGATIGTVLGPVIGGFLTENYNWRWIFFINIPIGTLAFIGLYFFMAESSKQTKIFDFFGFILLSLCVGAFQLMLDRGSLKDWFSSTEIIVEALISGLAFYLLLVHTMTREKTFINLELFKDRNFTLGVILIFIMYIAFYSTLALMPSMIQSELNYPVTTTGMITATQGAGITLSMLVVSRLIKLLDARYVIIIGLTMVTYSLWLMSHFSFIMEPLDLIVPGIIQGFGVGFSYIALTTISFSNLKDSLRDEGTAFFNLMRNLGCCLGIAIVEACLEHNRQAAHASLVQYISPQVLLTKSKAGIAAIDAMIKDQAVMIAYIDDFYLLVFITLGVFPLILLLKKTVSVKIATGIE